MLTCDYAMKSALLNVTYEFQLLFLRQYVKYWIGYLSIQATATTLVDPLMGTKANLNFLQIQKLWHKRQMFAHDGSQSLQNTVSGWTVLPM